MTPRFNDLGVCLIHAEARDGLRQLPDNSVHCCVTSPPYWSLRSYSVDPNVWGGDRDCAHCWIEAQEAAGGRGRHGHAPQTHCYRADADPNRYARPEAQAVCARCRAWRGTLGQEPTPDMFVEHLVEVFREVRRVLRPDGTAWVVIGDSYAHRESKGRATAKNMGMHEYLGDQPIQARCDLESCGLKEKDMALVPQRFALAMQRDGWWVRSDILWHKPNPLPGSMRDRPTTAHEYVWMFAKSRDYYYDALAIAEPVTPETIERYAYGFGNRYHDGNSPHGRYKGPSGFGEAPPPTRNKRDVWTVPVGGGKEVAAEDDQHYAPYPPALILPCVLASTSAMGACAACGAPHERVVERERLLDGEKADLPPMKTSDIAAPTTAQGVGHWRIESRAKTVGWRPTCACENAGAPMPAVVLDCFSGSGTTAIVAAQNGRRAIGIDLNGRYCEMAARRVREDCAQGLLMGVMR